MRKSLRLARPKTRVQPELATRFRDGEGANNVGEQDLSTFAFVPIAYLTTLLPLSTNSMDQQRDERFAEMQNERFRDLTRASAPLKGVVYRGVDHVGLPLPLSADWSTGCPNRVTRDP